MATTISSSTASNLPTMGPAINVTAIAEIVHDLLAEGSSAIQNAAWLRERAAAVGLGPHEYTALETLRIRLAAGGTELLRAAATLKWQ